MAEEIDVKIVSKEQAKWEEIKKLSETRIAEMSIALELEKVALEYVVAKIETFK